MSQAVRIYLIRHGEAAASWDSAVDPGLSAAGHAQAGALLPHFSGPVPNQATTRLISSPLLRAQQTAAPLAAHWAREVAIEDGVRELPSAGVPLDARRAWLSEVMAARWPAVDALLHAWRERAWQALLACREDTLFFTHFMVINALAGRALDDDRLVVFEPDYCSVTELLLEGGNCSLVALGKARNTLVL